MTKRKLTLLEELDPRICPTCGYSTLATSKVLYCPKHGIWLEQVSKLDEKKVIALLNKYRKANQGG